LYRDLLVASPKAKGKKGGKKKGEEGERKKKRREGQYGFIRQEALARRKPPLKTISPTRLISPVFTPL